MVGNVVSRGERSGRGGQRWVLLPSALPGRPRPRPPRRLVCFSFKFRSLCLVHLDTVSVAHARLGLLCSWGADPLVAAWCPSLSLTLFWARGLLGLNCIVCASFQRRGRGLSSSPGAVSRV